MNKLNIFTFKVKKRRKIVKVLDFNLKRNAIKQNSGFFSLVFAVMLFENNNERALRVGLMTILKNIMYY